MAGVARWLNLQGGLVLSTQAAHTYRPARLTIPGTSELSEEAAQRSFAIRQGLYA